jgi:hypothetical protein
MGLMLVLGITWVLVAAPLALVLGRSIRLGDHLESPRNYWFQPEITQDVDTGRLQVLGTGAP